jgi:hypothetical protein
MQDIDACEVAVSVAVELLDVAYSHWFVGVVTPPKPASARPSQVQRGAIYGFNVSVASVM